MGEHTGGERGRFRDTGLFLLALTVWLAAELAVSYFLPQGLDSTTALLISLGFELMLFVPAIVFIMVKRIPVSSLFGRATAAQVVSAAFLGMLILPVSIALSAVSASIVTLTGGKINPEGIACVTPVQYLLYYVMVGIAAPIVEEPMFRGIVLNGQAKTVRCGVALGLTGLSFTLLHGNLMGFASILTVGVIITFLAWHSGSIWPSIAMHMSYNSMIFLQYVLSRTILGRLEVPAEAVIPPLPVPIAEQQAGLVLGSVIWCFIAVPFAAAAGVILWSYWKHTPGFLRPKPAAPTVRLGFSQTWPWFAAFLLLAAYLAFDVLQIYGIMSIS